MVKMRCAWCGDDPLYVRYHDLEWGVPTRDRRALFELLALEGMQAGLSWITVLRKRRHMRRVFHDFDPERLARLSPRRIERALADPGVIRHRGKIEALARNARAYLALEDVSCPEEFLWSFVDGAPLRHRWESLADVPATIPTAVAMSKELRRRGFTFVGPTICYAFMQAAGLVNDHVTGCFRHVEVATAERIEVA
jgi:DNA-3-methyladenine glycosylase I